MMENIKIIQMILFLLVSAFFLFSLGELAGVAAVWYLYCTKTLKNPFPNQCFSYRVCLSVLKLVH
jgi:hypothetical protein